MEMVAPRGRIVPAFAYEGVAKELISALKFRGAAALAGEMAEFMFGRCGGVLAGAQVIIPAPAHPIRERVRGYNQSHLLARGLARLTGAGVLDCLARRDGRPPQSELGRRQRLLLAPEAVVVDGRAMRQSASRRPPKNFLLCDDVATTGITLDVCARAIIQRDSNLCRSPLRAVVFAAA